MSSLKEKALKYHSENKAGKLEINVTKKMETQEDLSLAYSPGVAFPCLEIQKNIDDAYKYTSKGRFIAIISNGTAVLGLGDIGFLAGKPVMEGKAALLKKFAGVDAIDVEVETKNPDEFITVVKNIGRTWGGINLEDIKAPECFEIETKLQELLDIPVFHDDQHGTAIVCLAAIINAMKITNKNKKEVKIIVNGAGAAAIASVNLLKEYGFSNIILCDTKGVIYKGRTEGMNKYKEVHASQTNKRTLAEALVDADVFIGLSIKGALTKDMLKSMAKNPIVFAMANPDPEITPEDAKSIRQDVIIGTGRSDYPNQINNVLCFPYLFRALLAVEAKKVIPEIKIKVAESLAEIARMPVSQEVKDIYKLDLNFGREYLIPKIFDKRIATILCPQIAEIAMNLGVTRKKINLELFKKELDNEFLN